MINKQFRLTELLVSGADDPRFWWCGPHGTRLTLQHCQSLLSLLRRESGPPDSGVANFWMSSSHLSCRAGKSADVGDPCRGGLLLPWLAEGLPSGRPLHWEFQEKE